MKNLFASFTLSDRWFAAVILLTMLVILVSYRGIHNAAAPPPAKPQIPVANVPLPLLASSVAVFIAADREAVVAALAKSGPILLAGSNAIFTASGQCFLFPDAEFWAVLAAAAPGAVTSNQTLTVYAK